MIPKIMSTGSISDSGDPKSSRRANKQKVSPDPPPSQSRISIDDATLSRTGNGSFGLHTPGRGPSPSSISNEGMVPDPVTFQRLVFFLTSLPLALSLFAFLILDPPLNELDIGIALGRGTLGLALGKGANSSSTSGADALGCPRAQKKSYSFPHRPWHASLLPKDWPRLGIMTTTAAALEEILPWLYYHRTLGVELFFIFAEGKAAQAESVAVLESIPGVRVVPRNKDLDEMQQYKPGRNKTLIWAMAGKPCNYELFVRQALNGDTCIPLARAEGVDWLIHIDTDELLYPAGTPDFSVQTLLAGMNASTDHVVFSNYESIVERDDVQDPFLEAVHGNPNYMLTYGNGKSAARVQEGLRSNGAHRFNIPEKKYIEHTLKMAAVLHFSYTKFSDLTSRSKRCHCKATRRAVKSCFFLEFDRQAYIVAATQTPEQMLEWYRRRVVWSNSTNVRKLLRVGIFERIYTPQIIIRGILSSGLVEATIKAGQEKIQRKAEVAGSLFGGREGGGLSHRSVEGAWAHLMHSAYGLVSSVKRVGAEQRGSLVEGSRKGEGKMLGLLRGRAAKR